MTRTCIFSVLLVILSGTISPPAQAQDERVYQSVRALSGKEMRVALFGRANSRDCKALPIPDVRVVDPPKNGLLTVRTLTLTTNRYPNCANLQIPAQVLFYQSRSNYVGSDSISFTVTFENGLTQAHSIAITVSKEGEPTKPQDL
jgi:hypothetical protein